MAEASKKRKVFTEAEAAEQMNCSAATLYRRRRDKIVRHYRKNGRLIGYTQEDIDQNIADMNACQPKPVVQRPVAEARFG